MEVVNKWIEKDVLIESEGTFCYADGCFKMQKAEFAKMKDYVDSIAILEGTDHREPHSLNDVVGKINNLELVQIGEKTWLKGTGHFNDEKVSARFKQHLDYNLPIQGSVANWVDIKDGAQTNMLPTHFLMSPDLEPNIPGAGIMNTNLIFNIRRLDNMNTNPELEQLKAENARLEAESASQKTELETINAQKKADLIKKLVNEAKYKEEELKEKSVPELELIIATVEKLAAANPRKNKAVPLGTNAQHYTLNAMGRSTCFFEEQERLAKENKLGSRVRND